MKIQLRTVFKRFIEMLRQDRARIQKKPRLFYWEDTIDAWAPVPSPNEEIPGLISVEQFSDTQDEIEIRFKRFDMTDEEMAAMPVE